MKVPRSDHTARRGHVGVFVDAVLVEAKGRPVVDGDAAEVFVNAGAHYIALDFIAIREAGGDLRIMADQVKRAQVRRGYTRTVERLTVGRIQGPNL